MAIKQSLVVPPILAATCAAAGATTGELTVFCVGRYGSGLIPKKLYDWLGKRVNKYGHLMVLLFSALPLPIFDIVGFIAGALKMKVTNFLATCFCGKLIKFIIYILITQLISTLIR